ncbi:MAG: hypothetical protein RL095_3933 [Verrucomicrobiota bacterium]|jgi:hypothetical protein
MRFLASASLFLSLQLAAAEAASVSTGTVKGQEEITSSSGSREISGVYPHLTAYSQSRVDGMFSARGHEECGIGGLVPWAGKLWMVTYAPHMPKGSQHKLYEIDTDKKMILRSESVGGTPAGRMVHAETRQLFIGHYAISDQGELRVISIKDMPGRVTAWARHLTDPANKVIMVDMEDMVYEVDVHSLKPTLLFKDPIPGYHGKGAYTAQGKLVVSNNGESGSFKGGLDDAKEWQVDRKLFDPAGPEDRGALATWDGKTWQVIERRQYTEVTGPEGIAPTAAGDKLPLWTIGWDKRSLRLQVLQDGQFHLFLLPKGCLNNDAKHGWFTEWPRIRDVGQERLLMDMHGLFFEFPKDFAPGKTGGLSPIGRHLRYIPDFCQWQGQIVLASDEASIQGNPLVGQPQSNLWFGSYEQLKNWGETSAAGSIWADDAVQADEFSAPFLIHGFSRRLGHFSADKATRFDLEIDLKGDGQWTSAGKVEVEAGGSATLSLPQAQWIRVKSSTSCKASVGFVLGNEAKHPAAASDLFAALPEAASAEPVSAPLLFPNRINRHLSVLSQGQPALELNELSLEFQAAAKEQTVADAVLSSATWGHHQGLADPKTSLRDFLQPDQIFSVDAASVILKSEGQTLRLPKGVAAYDRDFAEGKPRAHREVLSERLLANIHGTFYEVPFWIVGQPALYTKIKPVCTHNKKIIDYATWRGLLVLSGVNPAAPASNHVVKSADGKTALWLGAIDELWQLGKPVGQGGPWKDSAVKAGIPSDPYLMNGYDKKSLKLVADQDCTITLEADFDLLSGFKKVQTFTLKAGQELSYDFPADFAAHWVRVVSDKDAKATAWFTYR